MTGHRNLEGNCEVHRVKGKACQVFILENLTRQEKCNEARSKDTKTNLPQLYRPSKCIIPDYSDQEIETSFLKVTGSGSGQSLNVLVLFFRAYS